MVDHGLDPSGTPVSAVMTSQVVYARIDEDVQAAMRRMDQANIRHLPVIEGAEVVKQIGTTQTDPRDRPVTPVQVVRITVAEG